MSNMTFAWGALCAVVNLSMCGAIHSFDTISMFRAIPRAGISISPFWIHFHCFADVSFTVGSSSFRLQELELELATGGAGLRTQELEPELELTKGGAALGTNLEAAKGGDAGLAGGGSRTGAS